MCVKTSFQKGIPFEIKIPNDETMEAIKETSAKKNMTKLVWMI